MLMIVSTIVPISATTLSEKTSHPLTMENTLYVGGSGPNNYTKIQDAIANASYGNIIFVYKGNYDENLKVKKSITLKGEDKNTTIINGQNHGSVIFISSIGVTVNGFTIKYANGIKTAGVWLEHTYFSNISENNIIDNFYHGIYLNHSCFNSIIGNNISHNNEIGINIVDHSSFNKIKDNIISSNVGLGIAMGFGSNSNIIYRNIISYNHGDGGIYCVWSNKNIIMENTISSNNMGIQLDMSKRNNILRNNFLENQQDAYFRNRYPLENNRFLGNYWNQPRSRPKVINGMTFPFLGAGFYNWTERDWFPAQEPYIIP